MTATAAATAEVKKPPQVTITLSVSYPVQKAEMTLDDLNVEGQKALKFVSEAKKLGEVSGHVMIGKQRLLIADGK